MVFRGSHHGAGKEIQHLWRSVRWDGALADDWVSAIPLRLHGIGGNGACAITIAFAQRSH